MQQSVPTLNFSTCFQIPSNPTPQTLYNEHHPTQRQMPMSQLFSSNNQEAYFSQNGQNNSQMFNWYNKQEQQEQQQQQPMQLSLNTTPMSSNDSHMFSPNQLSPRFDYFYSVAQNPSACSTPLGSSSQFDNPHSSFGNAKPRIQRPYSIECYPSQQPQLNYTIGSSSPVDSIDSTGFHTPISEHFFPETPQTCTSITSPQSANIVSPSTNDSPLKTPPLTNAFATIDQWHKQDYDEKRQWNTKQNDFSSEYTSSSEQIDRSGNITIASGHQLKKVAHNAIERRYRNNINDCIHELKNVVPALYKAKTKEKKSGDESESDDDDDDDELEVIDGVEIAKKLNKATILHKATQYILHLKYVSDLAEKENRVLQQIISQMSGGDKVLNHFLNQRAEFQQSEQRRLTYERKMNAEREKIERQRILRERAAQRAALAELLPKQGRRPYRRRAKKNTTPVAGNKDIKTK